MRDDCLKISYVWCAVANEMSFSDRVERFQKSELHLNTRQYKPIGQSQLASMRGSLTSEISSPKRSFELTSTVEPPRNHKVR
jgi:hypothetical protein